MDIKIGNSDFKSIIQNGDFYLDKSAYIEEAIDQLFGAKLLIRPSKFGKTVNLTMLKEYFDITKKEENKDLFKGLYIDTLGEKYKKEQGAYPVIYLPFKKLVQNTFEDMKNKYKEMIIELYKEYEYILPILKKHEQDRIEKILNGEGSYSDYQWALPHLAQYLHKYYNKKVVVLIDDYDAPITGAYLRGFGEEAYSYLQWIYGDTLKDNEDVKAGVLTGTIFMSPDSSFNNVLDESMFDIHFTDKFGFTKDELMQILKKFNIEHKYEEIVNWYGYNAKGFILFNIYDVLNYIKNDFKLKPYTLNAEKNELAEYVTNKSTVEIYKSIQKLLNGEELKIEEEFELIYEDMQSREREVLDILVYLGYLQVIDRYFDDLTFYRIVKIANEVSKIILEQIKDKWFKHTKKSKEEVLNTVKQFITNQKDDEFLQLLKDCIRSNEDGFKNSKELAKTFLTYAQFNLPEEYVYRSERRYSEKRANYEVYKKDKSIGMMYQFEVSDERKDIDYWLHRGIEDLKEYTGLKDDGINKIWLYSFVFFEKEIFMHKEEWTEKNS